MGMIKAIIIIAVLLFAIWYVSPSTFDFLKNKASDAVKVNNSNSQLVKDKIDDFIGEDNLTNSSDDEEEDEPETYPCDLINGGLPDYDGTSKDGDKCTDVPVNQDYECLANPPVNYSGYINLVSKTSSPEIICCEADGYCRWGDD